MAAHAEENLQMEEEEGADTGEDILPLNSTVEKVATESEKMIPNRT